jgi:ABC-type multidrug transport system fused ATPase/permease subunit
MFAAIGWSNPNKILFPVTIIFGIAAVGAAVVRLALIWQSQKLAFQVGHDLGTETYRRVLCQPYLYHVSKNTSDLIAAVTKIDEVVYGTLIQFLNLCTATIVTVFLCGALFLLHPVAAASAAIGFSAIYLCITYATHRQLQRSGRVWADAQSMRVKTLQEGLGGIRDILLDQTQNVFIDKFRDTDARLRRAQALIAFIGTAPRYGVEAGGMVLIAAIAVMVSQQSGGLNAALPVLGVFAVGAQRLLPSFQQMYHAWTSVTSSHEALNDVLDVLDLPLDARYACSTDDNSFPFTREISFDNVYFCYDNRQPIVLRDICLNIRKGARVGIIGKTGSGKSTITDLVMGLLMPTSGEIRIDGVALNRENVRAWQAQIAHVPQFIYLMDSTIAENIAFGVPKRDIDHDRILEAVRRAQLSDLIASLPDGCHTVVGERGVRLSGGQRQRIGIARALYNQASVLVLDEATSALDTDTETAVMDSIRSLERDLTILIIAHRLSTVEMCDTIISVEGGRVSVLIRDELNDAERAVEITAPLARHLS